MTAVSFSILIQFSGRNLRGAPIKEPLRLSLLARIGNFGLGDNLGN